MLDAHPEARDAPHPVPPSLVLGALPVFAQEDRDPGGPDIAVRWTGAIDALRQVLEIRLDIARDGGGCRVTTGSGTTGRPSSATFPRSNGTLRAERVTE